MKQITCTAMDGNSSITEALPDGLYMVVRFNDAKVETRYKTLVDQVFPWKAGIYEFTDGMCDQVAAGSVPADLASSFEISGIYLVDLTEEKTQELTKKFADVGIELVLEAQTVEAQSST